MFKDVGPIFDPDKERQMRFLSHRSEIVDPGIRGLIQRINRLPFMYTDSSCSGHIERIDDGELRINTMPHLGVNLVRTRESNLRRTSRDYIGDLLIFGQNIKHLVYHINLKYYDKFGRNIVNMLVSKQDGYYTVENNREVRVDNEYFFHFNPVPEEVADLGAELLNDINEAFHKAVTVFETDPPSWTPVSKEEYLTIGPYNLFSQHERARKKRLL